MSLYQVSVQRLEAIENDYLIGENDLPAGYAGYEVVDTGANISTLPPSDLQFAYIEAYQSTKGPLAFTAAQALALVNYFANASPYPTFSAPPGDAVGVADTLQNLATLTTPIDTGFSIIDPLSVLASLRLSITAADNAHDIEYASASEIQALGRGITLQASGTSVELTIAQAIVFGDQGDAVSAPSGDTVTVDDSAASISALTPADLDAIGSTGVTAIVATNVDQISVYYYQENLYGTQGSAPAPYTSYGISDSAGDIQFLTPDQIAAMPAAGVYSVAATDMSLILDAAQAIAFENAHIILSVPQKATIEIVDTAAALEAMTTTEMAGLGALGISSIAADDTLPVFSLAQMSALDTVGTTYTGQAYSGVAVVAPPNDANQNDGTTTVQGPNGSNGLTFEITWDSSVASAPANFKTDVEEAFQFYADEFDNPITLYYNVGFGEVDGEAMERGANGESMDNHQPAGTWSYSQLLTALQNDAQSPAQEMAVASLPATDPTGGAGLVMRDSEADALGLPGAPVDSASSPDAEIGLTDGPAIGPSTDPNQAPLDTTEIDLIATAEHEISEGMGRVSNVSDNGPGGAPTTYALMDLFRFSGKNDYALSPVSNPSYFSIDDGATKLAEWNNYSAGNNRDDLGDWAQNANPYEVDNPASGGYTADSYNGGSSGWNPITADDVTLMNVLGYDLASPSETLSLSSQAVQITVGSLLEDLVLNQINSSDGVAPPGHYYAVVDTAFDIESVTAAELTAAIALGLAEIYVTDPPNYIGDSTLALTVAQAVALAVPIPGSPTVGVTPAPNSLVIISDTAADIEAMTPAEIAATIALGIGYIDVTDITLTLTAAQATALGVFALGNLAVTITPAANSSVVISDTAANLEAMSAQTMSVLFPMGVRTIFATDGAVFFSANQAEALLGLPVYAPGSVTVHDTADVIEGLTPIDLSLFDGDLISAVVSTDGSVVLSIGQALMFANADMPIEVPSGDTVTVTDTASDIENQLSSQSEVDQLSSIGVSAIAATDGSLVLSLGLAAELEKDSITVSVPQQDTVTLAIIAGSIGLLTPSIILGLPQLGITEISSPTAPALPFNVDQALALETADVYVNTAPSPADVPYVADTTAQIETLTPDQILALRSIGLTGRINATGASLDLTVAQAQALVTNDMGVYVQGGGIEIVDYASNIEAAMATFATDVEADQPFLFERLGTYSLAATDASIVLTVTEAEAMVEEAQFHFSVPAGDTVTVAGNANDIESLIAFLSERPGTLAELATAGISSFVATDTFIQLSVADALSLEGSSITVDAPPGDTVTIADTAARIETLTAPSNTSPGDIAGLRAVGVTAITATDASAQLTVAQAVALEQAGIAVTAPSGDTVTISDTAADIENMSKYQIAGLPAIGVSGVTATDASVALDVEQALAFEDVSIPITAPPGDTASVSDSEQQVDTLTPAEVAALPIIGVSDIEVPSLTGLAPVVTIAGGITLTVDGPISAGQTIDFAPSGGTLSAADYLDMQGTISGFAPADTIDLTNVDYQAGNVPFLTGNNELVFSEYGYPYSINLDPNQYFGDATFALNPDSGNGTDVNVTEAPISSYLAVPDGQTAYGLPIANGGTVEVQSGGALVGATVASNGTLNVDGGASAADITVQDGGYEYLAPGATATDTILTDPGTQYVDVDATATDTQVNGGQQIVYGSAVDTLVENGGEQDVESGGTATDTQIETGGNQYVFGSDSDAEITDGGTQTIGYGGSDSDSTVGNSGYQYVDPQATASGTLITDGGYQWDYGSVIDAVVASAQGNGGGQFVEQGGSAIGTTIERGGVETVLAGGTTTDTAIDGDALLYIQAEGAAEGDINFAELRGTLQLDSTSLPIDPALAIGAEIFGFNLTDRIELTGVPYDSNGQTNLLVGNELQITENGATYALQFDPTEDYSGEYFQLSPNELLGGTNVTTALMTPYTWTGDAGTSDLSDPDNWDALIGLAGLPGPQNVATFPTGGTIAGTLNAGVISIAGPVTYTNGAFSDVGDLLIDLPTGSTNGLILQSGVTGTVSGTVIVGQVGSAALAIEGSIESQAGNIGGDAGSNGSVVLDDSGASWTVANDLVVGDAGSGTLAISDGSLSALVEFVGLDGTGSVTQSGGTNTVGPAGTTTFVSDRAAGDTISVPAGTLFIGGGEDGPGTGSYTLAGGTLTADAIDVGSGGSFAFNGGAANFSTFELDNGGAVTASGNEVIGTSTSSDSTFIQLGGSNTIGSTADPAALVLGGVTGTTATYNLEGGTLSAADLEVGDGGTGNLTVRGGTATVTDAQVGVTSSGTLTLKAGGSLNASSLEVGADGNIVMAGGVLDPDTISIDAGGSISGYGTIGGDLTNDGTLDAAGGKLVVDNSVGGDSDATITGNAVLEFRSNFTENTSFAPGATGTLQLDQLSPDPIDKYQSSVALQETFAINGIFPSTNADPGGAFLGEIAISADTQLHAVGLPADGQLLSISDDPAPFYLIGTDYGGNGVTNYALPNLQGVTMVGAGDDGPAGGTLDVSQTLGSPEVTLTSADLPPALGGSSQPFNNYQPSLAVNYIINIGGDYPDLGGGSAEENMLGVVVPFAGNFAPDGWAFADGQLLPINGNTALFSILGTAYGGNGTTNFALPDLEGRDIVGAGDGYYLGEQVGQPTVALSNDQVPDASTAAASSLDNQQPGLVLNYLIATSGNYPPTQDPDAEIDPNTPYIGQVIAYAGVPFEVPAGWALADGQVLSVDSNIALFSLLGTTYGGNGINTFALPNLQGSTVIGSGTGPGGNYYTEGDSYGTNSQTINVSQLPLSPTISGFAPGDTIDLPNVAYDPTASQPTLSAGNVLEFTENGQQYSFNLDPNQLFFNPTFSLGPNHGAGTDITVAEAPVSSTLDIPSGQNAYGLTVADGGTVEVQAGATLGGGTVQSGGNLNIDDGASASGVTVEDGGTQYVASGGSADDTVLTDPGTQIVAAGATVTSTTVDGGFQDDYGTAYATLVESGGSQYVESGGIASATIIATGGSETVFSGGTASDTVISGGTLDVQSGGTVSGTIAFEGTGGTLQIDGTDLPVDPALVITGVISGFAADDTIDLTGLEYNAPNGADIVGADELQITEDGAVYDLQLAGNYTGQTFNLAADSTNPGAGTDITVIPCYCQGTLIRTDRGEIAVEALEVGDQVITKSGWIRPIKWIGRRSYSGRFVTGRKDILPVCIKADALYDNVPRRDLWISPHHAMYFKDAGCDGVLIEAKDLVNGVSIFQAESVETIEYFHIELYTHDVIIAEGALSESFIDDDSRFMFHNAHEYRLLYPDAAPNRARYCAPRLDHGYEVEAIRLCLALRAGIAVDDKAPQLGALRGYVDRITPHLVEGWAQNVEHPEAPACLDIYAGGRLIGQVLANGYREDLKKARLGSGHHGFEFKPPDGLAFAPEGVEVRRSLDGSVLCRPRRGEHRQNAIATTGM